MSTLKIVERKIDLPVFVLSETCDKDDEGALTRPIKQGIGRKALTYFYRPFVDSDTGARCNYNLFPIAFNRDGSPWDLACLYILDKLEGETRPNMESYGSIAEDLGAFKEWIDNDDHPGDLLFHFPKFKQARVTYRYREFLQSWIYAQEVKPKTAKRRMGTVGRRCCIEVRFSAIRDAGELLRRLLENSKGWSASHPTTDFQN